MKVIELLNMVANNKAPKRVVFDNKTFEFIDVYWKEHKEAGTPLEFLYRNENDVEDFLFRDYGIELTEEIQIKIYKKDKSKVICITTGLTFDSPIEAGKYYGFPDGDLVSKICRGVRKSSKGLVFKYIEDGKNE